MKNSIKPKSETVIIKPLIYFDVVNKNDRIYTAEEVMPKVRKLSKKIKQQGVVYGELNHPDSIDISLKNISHAINRIFKRKNVLYGEITILNTKNGKKLAKDLDNYVFRSRASGIVEENKVVKIK